MACHFGRNIIICRRGSGGVKLRQPCSVCPQRHTALCDWPTGTHGQTCDARLCEQHRARQPHGLDYCPRHAKLAAAAKA